MPDGKKRVDARMTVAVGTFESVSEPLTHEGSSSVKPACWSLSGCCSATGSIRLLGLVDQTYGSSPEVTISDLTLPQD